MIDARRPRSSPRWSTRRAPAAASAEGRCLEAVGHPTGTGLAGAGGGGVDHPPDLLDGVEEPGAGLPPAGDEDERGGVERVGQVVDQRLEGVGTPPSDVADDDHPAVGEQRRCGRGIDDRAHCEVVPRQLLSREGAVGALERVVDGVAHRVGEKHRVLALDQHDGDAHSASMTAARTSRTRQVPATSCTRRIRQPPMRPMAAAASDASRRSSMPRSRNCPRKVLLDADSRSA